MTTSYNACVGYFLDSLTGRSPQTRRNYECDLQQFKLFLVLMRPHVLTRVDRERLDQLQSDLRKADGKLWDTDLLSRNYKTRLRSQALLDWFDVEIDRIGKEDVLAFFSFLESSKGVSRSTLLRRLACLRQFFRLMIREGFPVRQDTLDKLNDMRIRTERKVPVALNEDEVLGFLTSIESERDRAIIVVMLFMGLRVSEVVQLNVNDIQPGQRSITIRGKGAKERYVPIHPLVHDAVQAYLKVRIDAVSDELGEPLFVSNRKKRIDPSTIRRFIKRYSLAVDELEMRKRQRLSPHKFRHTFATLLLSNGVDIRYIQELLGHQHLSTTEIYTAVSSAELDEAIAKHPLGDVGSD
ncbi:MAG: tyrosine-type recombinase/integrase [Limnochordia bacterium]|jgi:site-specific recombinase XerD